MNTKTKMNAVASAYYWLLRDPMTCFSPDSLDGGAPPAGDQGDPSGEPSGRVGDEGEGSDGNGNAAGFSPEQQEAVNRIAADRAKRAAEAERRKVLESIGFQSVDEAKAAREAIAKRKEQDLLDQKKFDELLALRDQEIGELRSKLTAEQQARRGEVVSRTILAAANDAGAVNAAQVAALVGAHFKVGDDGKVRVVDAVSGEILTDGQGSELTPKGFMVDWLNKNPHFKRAAAGRGSNSQQGSNGTTAPKVVDLNSPNRFTEMQDPETREAYLREMRAGRLKS